MTETDPMPPFRSDAIDSLLWVMRKEVRERVLDIFAALAEPTGDEAFRGRVRKRVMLLRQVASSLSGIVRDTEAWAMAIQYQHDMPALYCPKCGSLDVSRRGFCNRCRRPDSARSYHSLNCLCPRCLIPRDTEPEREIVPTKQARYVVQGTCVDENGDPV